MVNKISQIHGKAGQVNVLHLYWTDNKHNQPATQTQTHTDCITSNP